MDRVFSWGPTIVDAQTGRWPYTVSILSKRAAEWCVWKSNRGEWRKTVVPFVRNIIIDDGFVLVGFQPETGMIIAYKSKRR